MTQRGRAKRRLFVPFVLPALIVYAVIVLYPAFQAFNISLFEWSGFGQTSTFVGLRNFADIPTDPVYRLALVNNLVLLVVGGMAIFAIAFLAVAVLPTLGRRRGLFRAVVFVPQVVPLIALSVLWTFVYNNDFGLLNAILVAVGVKDAAGTPWMGPETIEAAVVAALVWTYAGFYVVLLMAAASRVPLDLYEASLLDGATRWQAFRHITLPLIWNVVVIGLVLWIIDAMNQFDFVFAVGSTTGQPRQEIWTLPIYVFEQAFGERIPVFRLGYATAVAVTLVALITVMIVVVRRGLRRPVVEY
jgi:ABC-type sugar transport system permease subunit